MCLGLVCWYVGTRGLGVCNIPEPALFLFLMPHSHAQQPFRYLHGKGLVSEGGEFRLLWVVHAVSALGCILYVQYNGILQWCLS